MLDFTTLHRGSDNRFYINEVETDESVELEPLFDIEEWDSAEAYRLANIRGYEPMTAKELETEEQQDNALNSEDYFIEEKFDGTRGVLHFFSQEVALDDENYLGDSSLDKLGYCRVFSRRISKKTGFYVENTDSVPHLRECNVPELDGTVLDGEMFIDGLPFKEVSSTLNCLWDKAVDRQIEKGFITFHAFDIIKYKGIDLRKMPLERRKVYLHLAVEEANNPYIKEVEYFSCGNIINASYYTETVKRLGEENAEYFLDNLDCETYPNLNECVYGDSTDKMLTPIAYYELIVATGGEGVIVKPKKGLYHHKRGWEYSKIKKFLTRDLILIDFEEPTREYKGKAPKNWGYWEGDTPVTRHYYNKQVGNLVLGVLVTEEELEKIPKNKIGQLYQPAVAGIYDNDFAYVMVVCVCGGFDDDTRAYFTRNKNRLIGSVVEVKANEIFKDSGKLRHPRFFRMRKDKGAEQCIWKDHIM